MIRTCLFLLFIILCPSAFSQVGSSGVDSASPKPEILNKPITADFKAVSLEQILSQISDKYGLIFSYVNEHVPLQKKVYLKAQNLSLEKVLDVIFKNTQISYVAVADQIVLVKKQVADELNLADPRSTKMSDSVTINPIYPPNGGSYKLSLGELLMGVWFFKSSVKVNEEELISSDSLAVSDDYLDSLKSEQRELRKARIRYLRSRESYSKNSFAFFLLPEVAFWTLSGATNQSIDYQNYNDYGTPDVSVSIGLTFRRIIFFDFYVQPTVSFSNVNRKGIHTDYLINFFHPNIAQAIRSNFSSNYNLTNLALEAGYLKRLNNWRFGIGAGYTIGKVVGKAAPDFLPYYEPKYYIQGPPYYNNSMERLRPEQVGYKSYWHGWTAHLQVSHFLSKKIEMCFGINYKQYLNSIYNNSTSIREIPKLTGLSLGIRYNFE